MPSSDPITLALPPFSGATRRLVLICLGVFFVSAVLGWVLPGASYVAVFGHLVLVPAQLFHGQAWQVLTYAFLPLDILGTLLTLLFLWFVGAMLEEERGSRWLYEIFFASAIGGGLLASALAYTHLLDLSQTDGGLGPGAPLYGLMIAILVLMGDREFLFFFLIRIRAKYLVIIYILIDIARLLLHHEPFFALLDLSGALCGYVYLRYAPRRGMGFGFSEQYFGLRNAYYRAKRRRAAKKFEVYMGKQGRKVKFDSQGRYIDPDEERKDPKDKKWMN
jgi:membrane associated rhomboid family serine protease